MQLLRHGQSHFNKHFSVTRQDPGIIDPALTGEGRRQIAAAAEKLAQRGPTGRDLFWKRIIASPYWRALETAEILGKRLGLATEVEPLVRERAFFACDIGSPRSELEQRFPEVDFGALPEVWWPHPDESEGSLMERCTRFRLAWAHREDWAGVLVVTHWGFIRGLTGRSVENGTLLAFDPTLA
jgi:broad specificity phosphatase PhoE